MRVWIDTDCGCNDAAAPVYLLRPLQVEIVGISATFGNTSVVNAAPSSGTNLLDGGHAKQ